MFDHLENFIRGFDRERAEPAAFDSDPVLSSRYYSDAWQNYFVAFPMAYVIPWGEGQRSDTEANNLVVWLLRNGIQVTKATTAFTWNGRTLRRRLLRRVDEPGPARHRLERAVRRGRHLRHQDHHAVRLTGRLESRALLGRGRG